MHDFFKALIPDRKSHTHTSSCLIYQLTPNGRMLRSTFMLAAWCQYPPAGVPNWRGNSLQGFRGEWNHTLATVAVLTFQQI